MPSRSHLTRPKPRNAVVELGEGDALNVTFDVNKITPAWMREAQARDEAQDSYSLPKCLAEVMIGWDVTEDDGSAFPPSAENIAILSFSAQSALLSQVINAAIPSSAEGNDSGSILDIPIQDSTPAQESPQNGQAPSPSLQPSAVESKT